MNQTIKTKKNHSIKSYIFCSILAICTAIVLRIFVFDSYRIPSDSMFPSIESGDYIIVNKLIHGVRIITNYNFIASGVRPNIWRSKGYRQIKRNDILTFNYPYSNRKKLHPDMNLFYVKRCIAIPGDTFYIDNGINKVKGISGTLGNYEMQKKLSLMKTNEIGNKIFQAFPKRTKYFDWNIQDFGPLYVPSKGDCLSIDSVNISLYKNLIEYETNRKIEVIDNFIFLNDSLISEYTFDINYYFMAGDNVFDSKDSRYWGLLPEDHIVGKVSFIYKSVDPNSGKTRWDRFLKSVE